MRRARLPARFAPAAGTKGSTVASRQEVRFILLTRSTVRNGLETRVKVANPDTPAARAHRMGSRYAPEMAIYLKRQQYVFFFFFLMVDIVTRSNEILNVANSTSTTAVFSLHCSLAHRLAGTRCPYKGKRTRAHGDTFLSLSCLLFKLCLPGRAARSRTSEPLRHTTLSPPKKARSNSTRTHFPHTPTCTTHLL